MSDTRPPHTWIDRLLKYCFHVVLVAGPLIAAGAMSEDAAFAGLVGLTAALVLIGAGHELVRRHRG